MGSASTSSSGSTPALDDPKNAVIRNAMRYSLSPREYQLLHKYLIQHSPSIRKRAPAPAGYKQVVERSNDYNAATIRIALRVFGTAYAGLTAWEKLAPVVLGQPNPKTATQRPSFWKQGSTRLSASLSLILLFHRLLSRFLKRLRASLLADDAKPFRHRNPKISHVLTSRLTPIVGASLAGWFLKMYPASPLRITATLYLFTRCLEFLYNHLERQGYLTSQPWWFGGWLLMPATCAQLLHAFVFDRDTFPASHSNFIMKHSTTYIQQQPTNYSGKIAWPQTYVITDALAEISRLWWPKFVSPIMFPNSQNLPKTLVAISPISSSAHPTIRGLSCALTHPNDPSCLRTYLRFFLETFPSMFKYFTIVFGATSLLRINAFIEAPIPAFSQLFKSILRNAFFVTSAIGTAWGSICLFQNILPRYFLPTKRWLLSGALAGCCSFIERTNGRPSFLFSTRMSLDSLWKVGVRRGWWRGIKDGDVYLFVASLAIAQIIFQRDPKAINSPVVRKTLSTLSGDGWIDRAAAVVPTSKNARVGAGVTSNDKKEV